jgi:hypothetical protein
MAHFARIQDGLVVEVRVINNEVIKDNKGKEKESIGINFCKSLFGENTEWVQTSYNGSFRERFATRGMIYNTATDAFEYQTVQGVTSE